MLKDFIAKETDATKGTVYMSGILTAEDNGTEVTGTGLCQSVYFPELYSLPECRQS